MLKKMGELFHGAAALAAASVAVKILGACYKIPLGIMLGPLGMANFSIAYNIYALLFVVSTAGVPAAVSKLVSESRACGGREETIRIYRISVSAFRIIGFIGFSVMFFGADIIARAMGSASAAVSIRAVSPAVFLVAISAVNRGYFQGMSDTLPTAVSEVLEAFGKLFAGLLFAYLIRGLSASPSDISAGAVFGVSAGAFLSVVYFLKKRKELDSDSVVLYGRREVLRKLLSLAIPITLGATVMSLTNVIDSALVINLMKKSGFSEYRAKWFFGAYNYAATLFNLPLALITAISVPLVPSVSGAMAERKRLLADKLINSGVKLSLLISVPAACAMAVLSDGIMQLLFGSGVERECLAVSSKLLRILCIAIPPLAITTVTNSIHHGIGNTKTPVISLIVGAAVKIISNIILVGRYEINIYGAAYSTVLCYITVAVLNVIKLSKCSFSELDFVDTIFKPMLLGAVSLLVSRNLHLYLQSFLGVPLSAFFAAIGTVLAVAAGVFCLKMTNSNDKKLLFGDKTILKILDNG